MSLTSLAMLLQDAPQDSGSGAGTVRIIAGVLAVILVVIIFLRRKSKGGKKEEDEF